MENRLTADFIHLHVHSHYTLLGALPTPKELAQRAKALGMPALALTDAGALYGAIHFYKACVKEGVKPIIGLDAFLAPRTRFDKDAGIDKPRGRVVLLAKNHHGYQNLIKLVTDSFVEGFYYRPRVDHELLERYRDDVVCIIPSFSGEPVLALRDHNPEKAGASLDWYRSVFGPNCYLEVTHHPEIAGHEEVQDSIIALGRNTGTPLVAAHDVYYLDPGDHLARETMIKIQSGGIVETLTQGSESPDFSFATPALMTERFAATPDALENSVTLASACTVEMNPGGTWYFPDYPIASGRTPDDELEHLAWRGVEWRGLSPTDPIVDERLRYEISVIKMKGYAKYFLVVGDLLREARERGILTTIRGSVAGSLTTYVLGITNVNPLEYNLPFERFLNPERPSAPDIDMDYADNRRDEMIAYAKSKYGEDNVAQIGTFGTMMARAAVRDVARALGHPYTVGDAIAKLIPMGSQGFPMTIKRALEIEPDLKTKYQKDAITREVLDLAQQIEGRARHVGVHAAGVVIAPGPLRDFVPVQPDPKSGKLITQYDMHSVGEDGVGLLKFDFLGIKNLSILADAVERVARDQGVQIDIENIPVDDQPTFAMLARGETMGLFQLNGSGMTAFLKQLKPTTIHDINAMVALYRPGPMESIPQYIERKHNPTLVTYLDPRLTTILNRSYGVITYQDDVMMISIALAGYSWLDADKLRKAMGKKIPEVMAAEKDKLLKGFVEYGKLSPTTAEKLWKLIEPFAAYGFNKCLPASTKILDSSNGTPTTIAELLRKKQKRFPVSALTESYRITSARTNDILENGVKDVYELTTRSGRTIRATANHPFRTLEGWVRLETLTPGTHVAVPRVIPAPTHPTTLRPYEAATLGYLISEGNLCHPHGVYFYSTHNDECDDFVKYAKQFKNSIFTFDRSRSATSVYVGQKNQKLGNHLRMWLTQLNLIDTKATQKFVPACVFGAKNEVLAVFMGKLWQGDGAVSVKNMQVFYATSSRALADDVQHLLLRFGIISTIHTKYFRYRGTRRVGYTINVSGIENLEKFSKHIGKHLLTHKRKNLEALLDVSKKRTNTRGRGTRDIVPQSVYQTIRTVMNTHHESASNLAKKARIAVRLLYHNCQKIGYTRGSLLRIGASLGSVELLNLAQSDVLWDEVVSVQHSGREMTYDLSVPTYHNFIANNFFVHNSHAASYGKVAYQTAYMKANYPLEYMAAVLTADSGDTDKISEIIHECERMGITVLPPDINESSTDFTVVPGGQTIRFGLTTIKNFGEGIAESIITERAAHGPFHDLSDFLTRIGDRNLNKKSLEALIRAGAFDRWHERGLLLGNLDVLLTFHKQHHEGKAAAQVSLFGESSVTALTLSPAAPLSTAEALRWEKELLGVYVSGHPLDAFAADMAKRPRIGSILEAVRTKNELAVLSLKGQLVTVGMVESVRELLTKKGDRMAFIQLADQTDQIEMVAFPETYHTYREQLTPGSCIAVKGKLSIRNDEPSIALDRVKGLGDQTSATPQSE
jgi:DNA polymerase-3 subunit alpha